MPNYRRNYTKGGCYFFTVVTDKRAKILCSDLARNCLRQAVTECQTRWPFQGLAWVLLEDHIHTVWTLPEGDDRYSLPWSWLKKEFSKSYLAAGGTEQTRSVSKQQRKERGIWQRRFWEHTLQNETDVEKHIDYIHYNPVKHGLVTCPKDYPYSSFHSYVKEAKYEPMWGCGQSLSFESLAETVGE